MKKMLETFLLSAAVSIQNSLNTPKILEKLKEYNITKELLLQMKSFIEEIITFLSKQQFQTSEKVDTTTKTNELFTEAFNIYYNFVKLARITFVKDDAIISTLDLNGERNKAKPGFILQGELFYENCLNNENILNRLKRFGITKEKLEAGQSKLIELKTIEADKLKEKEELKDLNKTIDEKTEILYTFANEFNVVAKIAFENEPELLNTILIKRK